MTLGEATIEIWWANGVAATAPGPGWSNVESGTLVGAMRVTGSFKEIRGKVVKPGVYTLRYGQQPQNGDHLGISPFREFLLLSPAAVDRDPKVLGFDGAVAVSKQTIGTSHPASLSLDPPEDAPGAVLVGLQERVGPRRRRVRGQAERQGHRHHQVRPDPRGAYRPLTFRVTIAP